MMFLKIIMK